MQKGENYRIMVTILEECEVKDDGRKDNGEKIVALAKTRGFVYPGSEIYGGLANTWDYGNLGVELKNKQKKHGGRNLFRKILTMSV